jgi:sporulation protein YlmC with PRC-barrel domain
LAFIWVAVASIAGPQVLRADEVPKPPAATVEGMPVRGILGRAVQDADGKEMGRVIDVIVDPTGRVRAAVIDFGGFLGVGSRKIAVDWTALHFSGEIKHEADIRLALTLDELKAAPEYKESNPVIIIGSTGALEPLKFPSAATPEK